LPLLLALQEAVGRRLRVYWPDEGDWFFGEVVGYDAEAGLHTVHYDDGDVEHLSLTAGERGERYEWVSQQQSAAAQEGDGRRLVRRVETADLSWPQEGDLLWGRIRVRSSQPLFASSHSSPQGHGWWPGQVAEASDRPQAVAAGAVSVIFFDNTSGWVLRSDCLPFAENFEVLHSRKSRVPSFVAAAKARLCFLPFPQPARSPLAYQAARQVWNALQSEQPPSKRTRLDAFEAGASGGSQPGLLKQPQRGAKPRSGSQRIRPAARCRSAAVSTLGAATSLLRRIDDLHSRLLPLVRQAQESLISQLQAGRPLTDEQVLERERLLAQLETLSNMPRLRRAPLLAEPAGAEHAEAPAPAAEPLEPPLELPVDAAAAAPEVDTSATDVEDDE